MNIRIVSDLHLESKLNFDVLPKIDGEENMTLVLAGDIIPAYIINAAKRFFVDACERHKNVVYIPGNHEYYHNNISDADNHIREYFESETAFSNLHFVNKEKIVIDDVTFLCCALWTDCDGENPLRMQFDKNELNDYHYIFQGPVDDEKKLSAVTTVAIHKDHLKFLEDNLVNCNREKTVVVTHHAPSPCSTPRQFINDKMNGFFNSNLNEFICDHQPKLWIHGHVHDSFAYDIGDTKIICNPMGYNRSTYNSPQNPHWNPDLVIDV